MPRPKSSPAQRLEDTRDPKPMPRKPLRDGLAKGFCTHMGDRKMKFKVIFHFRCLELARIAHWPVGALSGWDPTGSTYYTW
jgi:hypothetical protein